jgi:hypothetical protein
VAGAIEPSTLFAAFLASVSHDLEHTGTSNQILVAEGHEYVREMVDSVGPLESHHANVAVQLLQKYHVLSSLAGSEAEHVRRTIVEMIHATDIGIHGRVMSDFKDAHGDFDEFDPVVFFRSRASVTRLLALMMKVADVSHNARPNFEVLRQWRMRIYREFYLEGDRDRAAGRPLEPLHDRETNDIIKSTGVFIKLYVGTMVDVLAEFLDRCESAGVRPDALGWVKDRLAQNYERLIKIDLGTTMQIHVPLSALALGTVLCLIDGCRKGGPVRDAAKRWRKRFLDWQSKLQNGRQHHHHHHHNGARSRYAPSAYLSNGSVGSTGSVGSEPSPRGAPKEIALKTEDGGGRYGASNRSAKFSPVAVAGMLLIFVGTYSGVIFCSKIVLSTAIVSDELDFKGIRAPFLFGALHQLTVFLCFLVGIAVSSFTSWRYRPKPISRRRDILVIILFSLSSALNIGLNNLSISLLPISLNLVIRSFLPLTTILAQWTLRRLKLSDKGYPIGDQERLAIAVAVSCTGLATMAQIYGGNHRSQPYLGTGMMAAWVSISAGAFNQWIAKGIGSSVEFASVDLMFYRSFPTAVALFLPGFFVTHNVWPGEPPMTDCEVIQKVFKIRPSVLWLTVVMVVSATSFNGVSKIMEKRIPFGHLQAATLVSRATAGVLSVLYGVESLPNGWWPVILVFATVGNLGSFSYYSYKVKDKPLSGVKPTDYVLRFASKRRSRTPTNRPQTNMELDRFLSHHTQL